MAGAIAMAAALAHTTSVTCPHCGQKKVVSRLRPVAFRRCARCHKTFPDPSAAKPKPRR